jgi:hypothetical protein
MTFVMAGRGIAHAPMRAVPPSRRTPCEPCFRRRSSPSRRLAVSLCASPAFTEGAGTIDSTPDQIRTAQDDLRKVVESTSGRQRRMSRAP